MKGEGRHKLLFNSKGVQFIDTFRFKMKFWNDITLDKTVEDYCPRDQRTSSRFKRRVGVKKKAYPGS